MSLMASKTKSYTPPPEGVWAAVCVDVADLGMVKNKFDDSKPDQHKCRIVWELSEKMDDGRPYTTQKTYTVSLHEKASLYKDLKSWRGKAFTPEELAGFDVEKVIGAPCQIVISHEEKDGLVYGNITAIMKAGANRIQPSGNYIRFKDRPENAAKNAREPGEEADPDSSLIGDSDIPF
jgi:hypothetical protein